VPNEEECIAILRQAGAPDRVIKHVCTVAAVAETIAARCGADLALVRAGGLLHDLGRSRTHGLRHGVEGARLAREMGLPEELVLIIQKHVGAGITPEEARGLGLPDMDYMPSTLEEKVVCHADNLVGDAEVLTSAVSFRDFERKGLKVQGERMLAMHRELSAACGADVDDIARTADLNGRGPCAQYLRMSIDKWSD